jgi:very-short-patch-repair endonuclease
MRDIDYKLLDRLAQALEAHGENCGPLASIDTACAPDGRNAIYKLQQPAEIWEPFLRRIAARNVLLLRDGIERAAQKCESPAEELFFLALVHQGSRGLEGELRFDGGDPKPFESWCSFSIVPQYVVGRYRVDFLVSVSETHVSGFGDDTELAWHKGVVVVEVDGHEFHERTKQQASHDKKKDRDLQAAGFRVNRFTGSDIWNRTVECAREVFDAAEKIAAASPPLAVMPWKSRPDGGRG